MKFVLAKRCFWLWILVKANLFGWLLAFGEAKTGSKAQPKGGLSRLWHHNSLRIYEKY
jgi:hypothetical protein